MPTKAAFHMDEAVLKKILENIIIWQIKIQDIIKYQKYMGYSS